MGNDVCNKTGEDLGDLKDITIDMQSGRVACAALTFGGLIGLTSLKRNTV